MALGLLEPIVTKLTELIDQEARFLYGVKNDVQLLRDEFLIIKAFLEEVEPKHKDEKVGKQLFSQIRETAYKAEDVIEKYIFEVALQEQKKHGFRGAVNRWILCTKQLPTLHAIGSEIQDVRQRLDQIAVNRERYRLEHISKSEGSSSSQSPSHAKRRESSMEDERDPVGMESEAQLLMGQLFTGDAKNSIVSLIGMGGIGKTTLARRIYNDHSVREHFPCRSWVTVSKSFFLKDLLGKIMVDVCCINKKDEEEMKKTMDEQELGKKLSTYLSSKRYLVVLDDVWNIKDWDLLKQAFPLVENESKVMLTSRSEEVGMHANPRIPPFEMRFLNEKEAWDLFCKKVFMEDEVSGCPSDLEEVGKTIVGKCGGLPLAVAVLGGILRRRQKLSSEWQALLKSMKWELFEGETQIREILALSYSDLPSYLKPCFLYLSVFPEDFEISASKLIWLWVAEGFIEKRGDATKEETGEEYLKELIRRSLIQIKRLKHDGRVKSCLVHDLLRDFCILEAREVNFAHVVQGHDEVDTMSCTSVVRRQSIIGNASVNKYVSLAGSSECLRAFLAFVNSYDLPKMECKQLFRGFRLLRVIDIVDARIRLPKEIGRLIHLRYLGLSIEIPVLPSSMRRLLRSTSMRRLLRSTEIPVLPSSMRRLSNLETLRVDSIDSIRIPDFVFKLPRLRHLLLTTLVNGPPQSNSLQTLPQLNSLQTLKGIVTDHELDGSFGNLIHLKKLDIGFHKMDSRQAELLSNSIAKMEYLRTLKLWLRGQAPLNLSSMHLAGKKFLSKLNLWAELDEGRLDRHDVPLQLTRLRLRKSELTSDSFEVLQHLPNLRTLELNSAYMGRRLVCSAGGFPRLEFLSLQWLYELEEWEVEEGAFPRLTRIQIFCCPELRMLPEGFRHITTLNKLELIYMKNEFNARVRAEGEDYYKIRHVASLIVH